MKCLAPLVAAFLVFASHACSKKDTDSEDVGARPTKATSEVGSASALARSEEDSAHDAEPVADEREVLELDQDGNAVPATIDVPKGASVFADSATSLRIELGRGERFGVQVVLGNEYNSDLKELAEMLREGGYGATHEIFEKSATVLRYSSTRDGVTDQNFTLLIDLKGTTWVCKQGNHGGWTESQIADQIAACQTLTAR